ncbi:LPXTG cell wall anchor domain-containing protein [Listeria seeligeri]|uniref:LapB repeat-containing protein n=2 Tax=Listeria seeligeri TaxID=1640 RepID=UPI001944673F|nr:LapB repeat-containing protein [Listeria seeligeri]MBM5596001.1 LPXTG cell wall anchor domain-containing protein [Listeria seeligeri]
MWKKVCLVILSFSLCLPTVIASAEEPTKTQMIVNAENFPEGKTYAEFFPDQKLAIRVAALNGKQTTDIVTKTDLDSITELECTSAGISSISGLEYMENLTGIDFTYCSVTDLTPLTNLTKLTYVDFDGNGNIVNLEPLAGLTNLETLNLGAFEGNSVVDISPLANLTNLKALDLAGNNIVDVSALSGLTNLESLDIYNNEISDISALSSLTKLNSLFIGANTISDLTPLTSMQNLTTLESRGNGLVNKDLEIINSLSSLKTLRMQDNDITDLSFFNTCSSTSLNMVDFGGNHISDIRPIMTYRNGHRNLSTYDVTSQRITLPTIETKENAITIENKIFDINGSLLPPKSIDNKGTYTAPNVTWGDLNADPPSKVSYTFNNGGRFSGTVNQPINYLAPELTFDSEITYTVNTLKGEATFLSDVSAETDDNAEIDSNFESKVRMNTVGDYSVSIWSSNTHTDSRGTITVHVVAAPTLPTITADPEITYDEETVKTEAEFLNDVSATTEADATITSDFDQAVNLDVPGDYEVTLTSTNAVGYVTTKVIVHVVAVPALPTITADPEVTYDEETVKTEAEFLNDVSATTEADATITSDFDQAVNLDVQGDYEVTLTSTNAVGYVTTKVIVHVVAVPALPTITADKEITYETGTEKSEAKFFSDVSAKTEEDAVITSDFDQVVNLDVPGDYEVTLTSTNAAGLTSMKVIVHVVENATPVDPKTPENPKTPDDPKTPANPKTPENPKTPANPKKPVDPLEPVNPVDPKKPIYSINSEGSKTTNKKATTQASENTLPKTGDSSSYWVLLGLLCVGIAGFTWNKKRI